MAIKVKLETEVNGVHAGLHFVNGVHTAEGEEAEAKARKIAEVLGYEIIEDDEKKSEAKKPSRKTMKKDKDEDK